MLFRIIDIFFLVPILLLIFSNAQAQEINPKISVQTENRNLIEVFSEIENAHLIKIYFKEQWIKEVKLKEEYLNKPLVEFLDQVKQLIGYNYIFLSEDQVVWVMNKENDNPGVSEYAPKQRLLQVGEEKNAKSGIITLSGYVKNGSDGEPILGATVIFDKLQLGAVTNMYGFFTIKVPTGNHSVKITSVGFEEGNYDLQIFEGGSINFDLYESSLTLESIVIKADNNDINSTDIGRSKLNIATIEKLPAFLGEVDVIKSMTMLPGVSSVGEGTSGFNVRGGSADQNLMLLDDIILFNPSHLFGFFSVYNPEMVRDVTLYKGNMPPQYGGRLSSVLDVRLKEGNSKEFKLNGAVGLVSANLAAEFPIKKDVNSLAISARTSYSDWLLNQAQDIDIRNSSANFYDLTFKYSHLLGAKDKIFLTGLKSYDDFELADQMKYEWTNNALSLKWNHIFADDIFSSLTVVSGNYAYDLTDKSSLDGYKTESEITYTAVKFDLNTQLFYSHNIVFGGEATYFNMKPGNFVPSSTNSSLEPVTLSKELGMESALFLSDDYKISNTLSLLFGVRFSGFKKFGPDNVYLYNPEEPKSSLSITDTLSFSANEEVASYYGLEPRVSTKISLNSSSSVKLSYSRNYQYWHLLSNATAITPVDRWVMSDYHFKPQQADQVSAGYFVDSGSKINFSIEGYYKKIKNVIDYKDWANLLLNENVETEVLTGDGDAYGVELLLEKNVGRLNGWIGYTYSRSFIKIPEINDNEYYPSLYDKPHDISTTLNYKISKRFSISANFVYNTGRPITVPTSKYTIDNIPTVIEYSGRNQYRIPDYHRLDLSFTIDQNLKKKRKFKGSWVFAVYNVYARKNAYSVFFNQYGFASKLSVLGTAFPSITYKFSLL